MLDKNISWKDHIKTVESKLSIKHSFTMQRQTITC